jgi:Fur family ferric uptake transcriptional regulator
MTVARRRSPLAVATLDEAVAALRAGGLRVSAARRLVLEALFVANRPVSVEEIAAGLGGQVPPSDAASTYRNLETLEELGLVRHMHVGHGPGRYVVERGNGCGYLACEGCGEFVTLGAARLDPVRGLLRDAFGYETSFAHFPLVGLCARCAARRGDHRSTPRGGPHAHS